MKNTVFSIKIGGLAGQGVKTAGLYFSKIASRSGFNIYNYIEYPSLIRGGHNVMQTVFSLDEVFSPIRPVNFLIALNQETIDLHKDELVQGAGIVYEYEGNSVEATLGSKYRLFPIPLKKIANDVGGRQIVANNVALGAMLSIIGGNIQHLLDLISQDLSDKDENVVKINTAAARAGFDYAQNTYPKSFDSILVQQQNIAKKMVINGSDSIAYGAIAGGLQFAAIYPMSPISNILSHLASYQNHYGYIYKQAEDEISAINMSIGASFAGARSLTATSGGGFALMTEGYGLAGQTETPLVIIEGMRGGPATGLPTWSEQGDLRQVLHGHQSDFPRIVLAAGDGLEAFHLTMQAFNLADKYQTPVVLLVDKNILDNEQTFAEFDYSNYLVDRGKITYEKNLDYKRYAIEPNGISTRTIPGIGNHFVANSDEHDPNGYSSETIMDRNNQMQKRLKKLDTCSVEDMQSPVLFGPEEADITLVSWGSTKGSILEAIKNYPNVNYLHVVWMNPFPAQEIIKILSHSKHIIDIECNSAGQLAGLIREKTGINIEDKLLKNDGRPIYPEEIGEKITSLLKKS